MKPRVPYMLSMHFTTGGKNTLAQHVLDATFNFWFFLSRIELQGFWKFILFSPLSLN